MEKFRGKYRIESNRLKGWNYASNGMYFLTLVTNNRECNLGKIENDVMILSDFGKIIETEWLKSFEIRNELFLDEYIIMPNHLHAIVIIDNIKLDSHRANGSRVSNGRDGADGSDGADVTDGARVETHGRASLPHTSTTNTTNPGLYRQPKSISSFVGGFKSAINSEIDDYIDEHQLPIPKYNRNNHFFQPNYNDHIIRNHDEYQRIKNYIINNPQKWDEDKFNNSDK